MLSETQIERYSRQIILPQVGGKGQEKLLRARILVNGGGPLQAITLLYLAAAGVGTIGVHARTSFPLLSVFAADQEQVVPDALTRLNPDCTVLMHKAQDAIPPARLVEGYDLVLSPPGPLHDACYALHRPFLCTSVQSSWACLFMCRGYEPGRPCLHCVPAHLLEDAPPPSVGVVDSLTAVFLGSLQTTEALKLILGLTSAFSDTLLQCQFPALHFEEYLVQKDPHCWLCRRSAT